MALQDEIRAYVNLCHGDAWRKAHPAVPDEPALVSAFLSRDTYRGLRNILRNHVSSSTKVLVRGIFTHQTPKVLPKGKTQSVEIGDLMLVHQHFSTTTGQPINGRAILFQAKRARTPRTGSLAKGTEAIQFELYQSWPEFTGQTRLAKQPDASTPFWNFQNPSASTQPASDGAQYLTVFKGHAYQTPLTTPQWMATTIAGPDVRFVRKNYPNASTWSTGGCPPLPSSAKVGVSCRTDFADTLCDFLFGNSGRHFQPGVISPTSDHWSLFVNQMLAFSANRDYVYKLANQGITSSLRGRNLRFFAAVPGLFHAASEELDEFVAAAVEQSPTLGFTLTNALLASISSEAAREDNDGYGAPPDDRSQDALDSLPVGHVPLLLVMTHGPDELPFSPQRKTVTQRSFPPLPD